MLCSLLAATVLGAGAGAPLGSLQGGETLRTGGTVAVVTAGYSRFGAAWGQGLSEATDLGLTLDLDWVTTEAVAGGFWRQLLWVGGEASVALRARAGLYLDLGAAWIADTNRSDVGLDLQPGLAASLRLDRTLLSLSADAPLTFTFSEGGTAIALRGAFTVEFPVRPDVTVGARIGAGSRWSSAGAPLGRDSPRADWDVGLLATFQLL